MRIAYLADATLPSPAANTVQIMKMCAAFGSLGHSVTLFARPNRTVPVQEIFDFYAAPRVFEIARAPRLIPFRSSKDRWSVSFSLSLLPSLAKWSREYDLFYTRIPLLAALTARRRKKCAFEAHRPLPDGRLSGPLGRYFSAATERADFLGLVAISGVLARLYRQAGVPESKLLVAHDGVDLERFEPELDRAAAKVRAGLAPDQLTVGYCGHLYRGRGIEELLDCAAARPGLRFIFAGGNPGDVQRYRSEAEERKIENVLFTGFVPNREIPPWLYASDVLVMPYTRGTQSAEFMSPMKMFEYMAAGRPIIAPRYESTCEVLEHERNALLISECTRDALLPAIDRAVSDSRCWDYARNAREDVKKFAWKNRAAEILEFLDRAT